MDKKKKHRDDEEFDIWFWKESDRLFEEDAHILVAMASKVCKCKNPEIYTDDHNISYCSKCGGVC